MKSLFLALLAIASFAADSFGQTIINSVPYTISAPGTYVLGSNLTYSSAAGAAITILSIIAVFYYGVYIEHTGGTALNSGDIVQDLRLTNVTWGVVLSTVAGSIVRNNQITSTSNGTSGEGIDIFGGGGNLVSGNVISGFDVGVFAAGGNNYSLENMVSNCAFGFDLSASDKYRFNTTFNCTTPFFGGTALTDNNN
jgi:nitrous oxidase accessory protein NosD